MLGTLEWSKAPRKGVLPQHWVGSLAGRDMFLIWPVRLTKGTTYAVRRVADRSLVGDYGTLTAAKYAAQMQRV